MIAFQRAVDLGFNYLETDVRVTADGVALAFHDATLDRVTDRTGRLDQLRWDEVRRARIRGREPIPTLAEVLATWPDVRVNLDIKSTVAIRPAVEAITRSAAADRVCIGAFSTKRIAAMRRTFGPELCTAFGPAAVVSLRITSRARTRGASCVQAPAQVRGRPFIHERFIAAVHALGLPLHVYTVNEESDMVRLLDLGVDGLMTDRADLLREVLQRRGQWT